MRLLKHRIQPLDYVVKHVKEVITDTSSPLEMISEAPLWLRLLSRGGYCAYKKIIYVPKVHLELLSANNNVDKEIATAKLLPWIMLLHDYKKIGIITLFKALFNLRYQAHYFLYEYIFLKAAKNKFFPLVTAGFTTSRKRWKGLYLVPVSDTEVIDYMVTILSMPALTN